MNGYRTEPRRRFPTQQQNRHPVDVFSGYDDTEFHQPQPQSQQQQSNNTFSSIREPQGPGLFYSEYRSGRSSVPAHLLNSSSEPIFNRTHPAPKAQQKIPFIDTATDFDYPLTPKQILDTFQRQHQQPPDNTWFNNKQPQNSNWPQKISGEQVFDNWSPATSLKQPHQSNQQQQQQNINNLSQQT
uniref:Uncharacterized protein n=1 Tax=Panagrolaimus sp. PS1159 TaxID=55785 RepID=A0AC35FEG4_9BILA